MSTRVTDILNGFETVSLSEMDAVKLMDRRDLKFSFHAMQLPELLEQLRPHYSVLKMNGEALCRYKTLYFDTKDLELYKKHHHGHLNRYKVRYRSYLENNIGFLEVKFRSNKGRIFKDRMPLHNAPLFWDNASLKFLNEKTPYDPLALEPALWVNYRRITLVGKALHERVTLDLDLEFVSASESRHMGQLVIVEVKQPLKSKTPVLEILRGLRIKEEAMSKYCLGVTQLYPEMKKNNFKETLRTLNKLIYDTSLNAVAGS